MSRSVLRYRVLFPNKEDILFVCAHFFLFTLFSLLFLSLSLSSSQLFLIFLFVPSEAAIARHRISDKREKRKTFQSIWSRFLSLLFFFFFYGQSIFLFYFCFSFSILMFCFSLSSSFLFPDLFFCPCHVLNVCADKSFVSQSIQKQGTGFSCF